MPTPREAYTNSVDRQGYSGAKVRAADFGSAGETIGRAVQGFGQALGQVAQDFEKIEQHDAEVAAQEADNIRVARRLKRYYGDAEAGTPGFYQREGKDAVVDAQILAKDLDAIDKEVADVLKGKPRAQRLYNELTSKRNNDDTPKVAQHVFQQRNKYEDQVDADAFDLAIDNASTSLEPTIIEENIATAGNIAVRKMMRSGNKDPVSLANARQAGIGKAVAAVAEKMEMQSPGEAQAFVVLHAKNMDPQEAGQLLKQLAPSAAKERAGQEIGEFMVTTSIVDQANTNPNYAATVAATEGEVQTTAVPTIDALMPALWGVETPGGRHTNPDGSLITSSAGARGTGQIMPATGPNPGYGVRPLQNSSEAEHRRFSRDLLAAYTKSFGGNVVLGLTAYNWGPGNVQNHIKRVGDPSKGQISDAAFVNSIPVKEARDYAPKVLNNLGVSVGGRRTAADPATQSPTYQGEEINLAATYAKIDASDRTFIEKEALKSEASRVHSLGRQAKSEAEERVKEAVATHLNTLPPGAFTRFEQLPLNLRQQLASNPTLEQAYRQQATTNENNRLARIEAANNEARTRQSQAAELDMAELQFNNPDAFLRMDFRIGAPHLSHEDRLKYMSAQAAERKSRQGGSAGSADYDKMRTAINRFVGKGTNFKTMPSGAFNKAIELEQQQIKANGGKPLNDAQREGIALSVMMPVRANGETRARFEGPGTANIYTEARRLLLLRKSTVPSQAEIDDEVAAMRRLGLK